MLDRIIRFSIYNKTIILLATLALVLVGIFNLKNLPIDALPDITNNQVQILTTSSVYSLPSYRSICPLRIAIVARISSNASCAFSRSLWQ